MSVSILWRQLFLLASIPLFLAACTPTISVTDSRTMAAYKAAPKDEGLLVASSLINTGEVGQLYSLQIQRLDAPIPAGKKEAGLPPEYTFSNLVFGKTKDQSLFIGSVPAGRYQIVILSFGGKYLNLRNGSMLPSFTVTAGKTTDLGMLIVTAANFNVFTGRSKKFSDSQTLVNRFVEPEQRWQEKALTGWEKPFDEAEFAEAFALVHPQGVSSLAELRNGDVVAGTRLGTILGRNKDGKWRIHHRLATYDAITYVMPYPHGKEDALLALTDAGEAYLISDGKNEKLSLNNLPTGRVFFMDSNPGGTRWLLGIAHDNKAELFTANTLDAMQWQSLFSDDISFSTWSGGRNAWALKSPNGMVFASTVHPDVRCYDYSTESWTSAPVPDKRSVIDLKVNAVTGAVGLLTSPGGGFAGVFAKSHVTQLCENKWQLIKSPYSVEVAAPIGLNDGSMAVVGGVFGDEGFYVSSDKGKTWNKRSSEKVLSENFYQTINNGLFMVSKGLYGIETITHSSDAGASWSVELSSFDSALYKAQQERDAQKTPQK